ncbi:MAG: hypothetical protein HYS83_00190 [Candidatus Blackburnbacteria bacterium]|nr:hypothetical protein [Candidatus Blackburnbacteria bacterium]
MANITQRQIVEIINKAIKPIVIDITGLKGAAEDIKRGQINLEFQLRGINRKVSEIDDKVGGLIVDVHNLQGDVKGLWDDTTEIKQKQERRFKEIREELGLQAP